MKYLCAIFIVLIFVEFVNACTIEIPPLRKEFRKANSVFVGKVLKIQEYKPTDDEKEKLVSEDWQSWTIFSKVTFEIPKKYKGDVPKTKEFLATAFYDCGCPDNKIDEFEIGKEYLVFAQKRNFLTICESKLTSIDSTKGDVRKLNEFGFRLWARIYPF